MWQWCDILVLFGAFAAGFTACDFEVPVGDATATPPPTSTARTAASARMLLITKCLLWTLTESKHADGFAALARLQRRRQDGVLELGFLHRDAAHRAAHLVSVDALVAERSQHLEDGVAEAELEDLAGDRGVRAAIADVRRRPRLLASRLVVERPQRLRMLRREPRAAVRAEHLQ